METSDDSGSDSKGTDVSSDPGSASGVLAGIKGMISFFTIFRLNVGEKEISAMEGNFCFVPVIGFFTGFIASLVGLALYLLGFGNVVTAAAVLATFFMITKFLHFDGLTDFGDGMIASGPRDVHIRALKDTHIGAGGFGVALIVTLISFVAITEIGSAGILIALAIWPLDVMTKNAMVSAAAFGLPGNGMAANQVRRTGTRSLMISSVLSAVLSLAAVFVMGTVLRVAGITGPVGMYGTAVIVLASLVVSVLVGWVMARAANGQFGFVNGDILGATNEIARPLIVIVALALIYAGLG